MIQKGNRVRHRDVLLNEKYGVMVVRETKGDFAVCGYNDFEKIAQIHTIKITDLKKSSD
ncbi:hypothetical protein RM545_17055 [Zunongwangia sp. F260]|uniref:Uncharacterized protein n=1 Tax=Autumnicola lenta TaxID=3075593 RepID=A0ABU3CQ87_9FLAO|nr:hypothetical protein [Zunongwangia sp. F260]MDT0648403.1 hypothetical protein [Zunongwangia sp. F260]